MMLMSTTWRRGYGVTCSRKNGKDSCNRPSQIEMNAEMNSLRSDQEKMMQFDCPDVTTTASVSPITMCLLLLLFLLTPSLLSLL